MMARLARSGAGSLAVIVGLALMVFSPAPPTDPRQHYYRTTWQPGVGLLIAGLVVGTYDRRKRRPVEIDVSGLEEPGVIPATEELDDTSARGCGQVGCEVCDARPPSRR